MKIVQIVDALPSLQKLAKQDLSIKKLYQISKLMSKLDTELAFYNERRNQICTQYCDVVDGKYVVREVDEDKFNMAMSELLNLDVQCDIVEVAIDVSENIKLSYNDIVALKGFVSIESFEDGV